MRFLKLVRRSGKQVWALTRGHGAAIILFTLILLMVTWPSVRTAGSSILGIAIADAWEEVEQFWWYKQALIELRVSPFLNPNIFFPEGWHTVTGSHSPTLMLPTVPFTMLMGPIGSYFFLMLAGFLFAGLGTYVAIYHLTQDRLAGVLGGVSYAFCMSRMLGLGGHFNTATGSAWIPWVFACLELAYSHIFLGLTATVLAISAIARRIHPRATVYVAVMLVSMVMAMGPQMYWNNAPVQLELP